MRRGDCAALTIVCNALCAREPRFATIGHVLDVCCWHARLYVWFIQAALENTRLKYNSNELMRMCATGAPDCTPQAHSARCTVLQYILRQLQDAGRLRRWLHDERLGTHYTLLMLAAHTGCACTVRQLLIYQGLLCVCMHTLCTHAGNHIHAVSTDAHALTALELAAMRTDVDGSAIVCCWYFMSVTRLCR